MLLFVSFNVIAAPGNAQQLTLRHFVLSFLCILTPISPVFINNQTAAQGSCPNDMAAVADMLYTEVASKAEWRSRFYGNLSRDAARTVLGTCRVSPQNKYQINKLHFVVTCTLAISTTHAIHHIITDICPMNVS
jgi:hypothetical protein